MTISEACERTGLTKKAIRHYESLGLVSPRILPNGYRVYGQGEVSRLNQVALLSHLGFSLAEISEMLEAPDSADSRIGDRIRELKREREKLNVSTALLEDLLSQDLAPSDLQAHRQHLLESLEDKPGFLVDKLSVLFPGGLGQLLGITFGHLIDDHLQSDDAIDAWRCLIQDLDALDPVDIPDSVTQWTQQAGDGESVRSRVREYKQQYAEDYDTFASKKLGDVQEYLSSTSARERQATAERSRAIAEFFAGPAAEVGRVMQQHLPRLSESYRRILEHQMRLFHENPELLEKLAISHE